MKHIQSKLYYGWCLAPLLSERSYLSLSLRRPTLRGSKLRRGGDVLPCTVSEVSEVGVDVSLSPTTCVYSLLLGIWYPRAPTLAPRRPRLAVGLFLTREIGMTCWELSSSATPRAFDRVTLGLNSTKIQPKPWIGFKVENATKVRRKMFSFLEYFSLGVDK